MDWKKQPKSYWQERLTPEEFNIAREAGTERAFSGEYWDKKDDGEYLCKCCGQALFDSKTKYDSGSGWPSFYQAESDKAVDTKLDTSHGMSRTEVTCSNCGAHLGHLFPDGPKPTGERFCMNSASLKFKPRK